jgi:hypothetical protein
MSKKANRTNDTATFVCLDMTIPSLGKRNAYRSRLGNAESPIVGSSGQGVVGRARNSCAEANVCGCQSAQQISNSSDSHTETSAFMFTVRGPPQAFGVESSGASPLWNSISKDRCPFRQQFTVGLLRLR